jgi:hypothetical protein
VSLRGCINDRGNLLIRHCETRRMRAVAIYSLDSATLLLAAKGVFALAMTAKKLYKM